tara:strand:- start:1272 stop:1907 length:636 start_codon:yes stop_codon:yes gene_type:complete
MIDYLIIGTGRSGTGFMSELLTTNNIRCGHESVFGVPATLESYRKQIITTNLKSESSWLSVPFITTIKGYNENIKFIHIVRNPINVIKSWVELDVFSDENIKNSEYVQLIKKYVDLNYESSVEKTMSYYIGWIKMIEGYNLNRLILNLEDINYDSLSKFLGKKIKPLDKKVNTKKEEKVIKIDNETLINDIKNSKLYNELKGISKKYGYDI